MDDWLIRRLEDQGYIDRYTGGTRKARPSDCPSCGQRVIRGIDADWCGRSVDVDPDPLTQRGELLARLLGMVTFEVMALSGRMELGRRDHWRIEGRPAGASSWRGDVLVEHQCHRPRWPLAAHRRSAWTITPTQALPMAAPF